MIDFDNYEDFDFDQPFINCPKCGRLLLFNEDYELIAYFEPFKKAKNVIGQVRYISHDFDNLGLQSGRVYNVIAIDRGTITIEDSRNQEMKLPLAFYGEGASLFTSPWEIIFDPSGTLQQYLVPCDDCNDEDLADWFCEVTFGMESRHYTYRCGQEIVEGDFVEVPVGEFGTRLALVTKVHNQSSLIQFPLDRLKTIFGKARHVDWSGERLPELLTQHPELAFDDFSLSEIKKIKLLKLPVGYFWIEADGTLISFWVKRFNSVEGYPIDGHVMLIADDSMVTLAGKIKLCTDIDFSNSRYIDILSDEFDKGSEWQIDDHLSLGITASTRYLIPTFNKFYVPYYLKKDQMGVFSFQIGWKAPSSSNDLSLCFNLT